MLTDAACKNAVCPPEKKRARFTDLGGLYLEVSPTGSKRWFLKLYRDGKETRLAMGSYPTIKLSEARKAQAAAKLVKEAGENPVLVRRMARAVEKLQATRATGDTFKLVALGWYGKQSPQ